MWFVADQMPSFSERLYFQFLNLSHIFGAQRLMTKQALSSMITHRQSIRKTHVKLHCNLIWKTYVLSFDLTWQPCETSLQKQIESQEK